MKHLVRVGLRDVERRNQPEEQAGAETRRGEKREHPLVHREADPVRHFSLDGGGKEAHTGDRERESEQAGDEREEDTLHQQLPDDPPSSGPERRPDRDFARSTGRAGEQQVGGLIVLVLRHVCMLVSIGIGTGTLLSWWAAQFVDATWLYGVQPRDPTTLLAAALTLDAVGALAGWLPAYRATRIDPADVLRNN